MAGYKDPEYQRNRKSILAGSPLCHWCGQAKATQADHLIELDAGGDHSITNLVPSCASCNARRGTRYLNKKIAQRIQNRDNSMSATATRPCQTCGKPFKPDWRNEARGGGKYCSRACVQQPWRKPHYTYIAKWDCRVCGKPMAHGPIETTDPNEPRERITCGGEPCQRHNTLYNAYKARYKSLGIPEPITMPRLRPSTWEVHMTEHVQDDPCLLYTSPSPRDVEESRMPSSA